MHLMAVVAAAVGLALVALGTGACAQEGAPWVEPDLPERFTRVELEDHPEESSILTNFLWRHYRNRRPAGPSYGLVLFNQEYLATADLWLAGAVTGDGTPAQQAMRRALLSIRIDDEGYVHTHQHFSHAHDRAGRSLCGLSPMEVPWVSRRDGTSRTMCPVG